LVKPKIDRIGQDRRHQQGFILGGVAGLQVREVAGEARPLIDLHGDVSENGK
jgi:hypothetical protein